jgi:hypothetical protein
MCKSLHCPLHGQNCWSCLNSAEGEFVEEVTMSGVNALSSNHAA